MDGGLGDVLHKLYSQGEYRQIENLDPEDRAEIVLITTNPFADELFKWHPKRKQLKIRILPAWSRHIEDEDSERRARYELPPKSHISRVPHSSEVVKFYPSPSDLDVITRLGNQKYFVFAASSYEEYKIFPPAVFSMICQQAKELQIKLVAVGRNYTAQNGMRRYEPRDPENPNIIDLIDKLSVPGTARVVEGAQGVVCSHSSINLLAWHLKKPTLLFYPQEIYDAHVIHGPTRYTTFGLEYPTTRHALFKDCTVEMIREFFTMTNGLM